MTASAARARPRFDAERDAEVGLYVTDGRRLLEVAGVQVVPVSPRSTRATPVRRLRLVDCAEAIPASRVDEMVQEGEWVSMSDAERTLRVVRP